MVNYGVIRVAWPTYNPKAFARVWRVLDLSGMTNSVRESRNFTRAGFVFLDGQRVQNLRTTIQLGRNFILELRFPNGVTKRAEIFLFQATRHTAKAPRITTPDPFEVKRQP